MKSLKTRSQIIKSRWICKISTAKNTLINNITYRVRKKIQLLVTLWIVLESVLVSIPHCVRIQKGYPERDTHRISSNIIQSVTNTFKRPNMTIEYYSFLRNIWQTPCSSDLRLNIKFLGLFIFLWSWGDIEVVELGVDMWWNHPWPYSWKTPKHRGSPHTLILILSNICLETKNSWLGMLVQVFGPTIRTPEYYLSHPEIKHHFSNIVCLCRPYLW